MPRARGDFGFARNKKRAPMTIEGELVAKSTGTVSDSISTTACSTRNSATAMS